MHDSSVIGIQSDKTFDEQGWRWQDQIQTGHGTSQGIAQGATLFLAVFLLQLAAKVSTFLLKVLNRAIEKYRSDEQCTISLIDIKKIGIQKRSRV